MHHLKVKHRVPALVVGLQTKPTPLVNQLRVFTRNSRQWLLQNLQQSTRGDQLEPIRLTRRCGESSILMEQRLNQHFGLKNTQLQISKSKHVFIAFENLVIDPTWLQFYPYQDLEAVKSPNIVKRLSCFVGTRTLLEQLCKNFDIPIEHWEGTSKYIPKKAQLSEKQLQNVISFGNLF